MARDAATIEREFLALYEEGSDAVFRHCYFRVSDRELAKDMTQEAFARTWEYVASGKVLTSPKAFVFRTANNLIIDHYRRKKEVSLEVLAENGFDPSGDDHLRIPELAAGKEALGVVNKLSSEYREVVLMRFIQGLPIAEIAAILGESENVVSVRTHRALAKLRELLTHGPT